MSLKNHILKLLTLLLLLIASVTGVMGQTSTSLEQSKGVRLALINMGAGDPTSTSLEQSVCPGTEPYLSHPSNKTNTFIWNISGGVKDVDWTITNPTDTITNIIWTNPAVPQKYLVMFSEIDTIHGCHDDKVIEVTVNPEPEAPTAGANQTECEQASIQMLTATATPPPGSAIKWYTAAADGYFVANAILNTVGTVTYYAESEVIATGCKSLTRVPVTLTINPMPAPVIIYHR